jgi:flagellar biosynthesis/type III secretory pathway M-ring protein FliF/YscJ
MQSLQRTLQMIAGQLKGLSASAKMLLGSIMIILIMSLFLVSLYAGRQNMVPLGLGAGVNDDARARTVTYLKSNRIAYEVSGGDLLVPAEQKFTIWAHLTETQVVGADQINFDRLLADESPFRTSQQNRQRYIVAKMNVLSGMISQMTGIERATVVIDPSDNTAIGKSHIPSSASVTVLARGGELGQQQVDAIARLVAGSHAGLKPQNVSIIDARTGRAHQARTDDYIAAGRYMEVKQDAERHVKASIENALGYIPGVRISVNALVDTKQVVLESLTHDEPKIAVTEDESEELTSSSGGNAAEPGVRPNTGASLVASSKPASQMTETRNRTNSVPFANSKTTRVNDAKGYALQINASIGVPKSYFVRLFQDRAGDASKQPDNAELQAIVTAEADRIKKMVMPLVHTQPMEDAVAGTVEVSMDPDFGAIAVADKPVGDLVSASGSSSVGGFLPEGLIKYVSLGGLAALSLLMMFLMVRRAGVREELPTASELVGIPPALAAAETDLVGEADEASPALEGIELTDDAIRRQQMLEQITDMVTNTPDDAASLLRRWMKSEG